VNSDRVDTIESQSDMHLNEQCFWFGEGAGQPSGLFKFLLRPSAFSIDLFIFIRNLLFVTKD
jgi:hypothetical protein